MTLTGLRYIRVQRDKEHRVMKRKLTANNTPGKH